MKEPKEEGVEGANSRQSKPPRLEDTIISFALVLSGTVRDFEDIKSYARSMTTARLVYQKKSLGRLKIIEEVRWDE